MKALVALAFVAILASLGAALMFMMKGGSDDTASPRPGRMAWALALRVGLSVLLFICILLAWALGYISPGGVPLG